MAKHRSGGLKAHMGGKPGKERNMNKDFSIGSYVTNYLAHVDYDALGIVRGTKADGSLVLENPRIGRWIADPAKCKPYIPPVEG